jgi:hypothetical protein
MNKHISIRHKRRALFSPLTVISCAALVLGGCSANRDKLKIKTACDISDARPANPNGSVLVAAKLAPQVLTPDTPAAAQAQPEKPAILFSEPPPGSGLDLSNARESSDAVQVPSVELPAAPPDQPKTALRESRSGDHTLLSSIYKGC